MELKLQQAIVATRAGRTGVAQNLLTQLIRENPNDADAWFLLGHLVEPPDRQALYFEKTIELDPDHAIAKQRLMRLQDPSVPAPVFPQQEAHDPLSELNGNENSQNIRVAETTAVAAAADELPEWLQDLDNKQLETTSSNADSWQVSAGTPIRESDKPSKPAAAAVSQNIPTPEPAGSSATAEVRLVRLLVIMVIVAAIVLGILVLLIMI